MKNSTKVSVSGIMSALSVAILFLGAIFPLSTYVMPVVASLVMIILIENFNKKIALTVFVATSLLAIILVPDKECSLIYIGFFGYYPICQEYFNKIRSKIGRLLAKLILFNVTMISVQYILIYIFMIPFEDFLGKWGIIILLVTANLTFFCYERVLYYLRIIYRRKYKKKFAKLFKK